MAKFICPECTKRELFEHCPNCNWLRCDNCSILISPHNTIYIGAAKKRDEAAKNRRNGV